MLILCTMALAADLREPDLSIPLPDGVTELGVPLGGADGLLLQRGGERWYWSPDEGWRTPALRDTSGLWQLTGDGQHVLVVKDERLVLLSPRGRVVARGPVQDVSTTRVAVWGPDRVARCVAEGLEIGTLAVPRQQLLPGPCDHVMWHGADALLVVGDGELLRVDPTTSMPEWRARARYLPTGAGDPCVARDEGAAVLDSATGQLKARVPVVFRCRTLAPGRLLWRQDDTWTHVAWTRDGAAILGPPLPEELALDHDVFALAGDGSLSVWQADALTDLWEPTPLPARWHHHPLLALGLVTDASETHLELRAPETSAAAALAALPGWWEVEPMRFTNGSAWLAVAFPEDGLLRFDVYTPAPRRLSRRPDAVALVWAEDATVHVLDAGGGVEAVRQLAAAATGSMGYPVFPGTTEAAHEGIHIRYRPEEIVLARTIAVTIGRDLSPADLQLEPWPEAPAKVVVSVGEPVTPRVPDASAAGGTRFPAPTGDARCALQPSRFRPSLGEEQQGVPVDVVQDPQGWQERVTWPDGVRVEVLWGGCTEELRQITFTVAERPEDPRAAALALMDRVEPPFALAAALRAQDAGRRSLCDGPGSCTVEVSPTYDGVRLRVAWSHDPASTPDGR